MNTEEQPQQPQQPQRPQEPEVPDDAIEVAQVQYAWLWSSWWLLAIVLIIFVFGIFPDPFTPAVLAVVILIPKYWHWRRTRYYLTEDALIYQRGGIMQTRRYLIPFSRLKETRTRFGMFGRALGFQHVDIMLENGAIATLVYVPAQMDIAGYFQKHMGGSASEDMPEEGAGDEPAGDEEKS
ncbi:MAG: PH domain-containing protein [Chloroflexi bacterium]|nr:PH domain-containing protein [Chloroflexota bacterium]